MDFDKLFPNRWMKAGLFDGKDVTLKILKIDLEELDDGKKKEIKAILTFESTPKQLVLNKTNGICIKAMFGRETTAWIGKRVTFFPANESFGETDICVRVRGSPDIAAPIALDTTVGRRKLKVTLQKTAPQKTKGSAPPPANGTVAKPLPITHPDAQPPDDQVVRPLENQLLEEDPDEVPL